MLVDAPSATPDRGRSFRRASVLNRSARELDAAALAPSVRADMVFAAGCESDRFGRRARRLLGRVDDRERMAQAIDGRIVHVGVADCAGFERCSTARSSHTHYARSAALVGQRQWPQIDGISQTGSPIEATQASLAEPRRGGQPRARGVRRCRGLCRARAGRQRRARSARLARRAPMLAALTEDPEMNARDRRRGDWPSCETSCPSRAPAGDRQLLPARLRRRAPGDARNSRRHRRRRGGAVRRRSVPDVRALRRRAGLEGRADQRERESDVGGYKEIVATSPAPACSPSSSSKAACTACSACR